MKNYYLILIIIALSSFNSNAQQWGDYTLYSVQNSSAATLVDTNGNPFHTWTFSTSAKTGYTSYLLPGGDIIRSVTHTGNSFSGDGITGAFQKTDWNGNVLWNYVYSSSTYCMHHDICPLPNGNVLLISYESKTASEVTQAGCSQSIIMWPDKIVEIHQTGGSGGSVVWQWHVWDHLVQTYDPAKSNYQSSISAHPELLNINYQTAKDWMHCNGIDYNAQLDQIVFSSPMLNEFYVIDHSTTTAQAASHSGGNSGKGGDFLYRWGNPAAYSVSGTADFNVVHDAHFIPDDCPHAGYFAGFNNNGISNSQSCIDLVNPPRNGYNYLMTPGTANSPAVYNYRHACNGHTSNMGSSQELPNGNMLVCIAQSGTIYEIDSNQNVLWTKNVFDTIPNAMRYDACYISGFVPIISLPAFADVCANAQPVTLTGEFPTGGIYSGNAISVGTFDPSLAVIGSNSIIYTYSDSFGCGNSDTANIIVNPLPVVTMTSIPPVCQDAAPFLLTGGNPLGGYYSGQGVNNGIFSPLVTGSGNFLLTYTFEDTLGCANDTQQTITVNPLPNVQLGSDTVVCTGNAITLDAGSGFASYHWSNGSSLQTLQVSSGIAAIFNCVVTVTDLFSCANSDSLVLTFDACSGIGSVNDDHSLINISPNPFIDNFRLYSEKEIKVKIYNMSGMLVEETICIGSFTIGQNLGFGAYVMELIYENQKKSYGIVKME